MNSGRRSFLGAVLLLALAALAAGCLSSDKDEEPPAAIATSDAAADAKQQPMKEAPSDFLHEVRSDETRGCLEVRHRWPSRHLTGGTGEVSWCIDEKTFRGAVDSFGVEAAAISFEYSSQAELERLVKERSASLTARGFLLELREGQVLLRVDYVGLVETSRNALSTLREQLDRLLPAGASTRERLDLYAEFLQSMPLVDPARIRTTPSGKQLIVAGTLHPLETVVEGKGDCDGLTIAFAGLARGHDIAPLVLLGTDLDGTLHLFAAAAVQAAPGDLVVQIDDQPLVVYELTSRDAAKALSDNARKALLGRDVQVFQVGPQ